MLLSKLTLGPNEVLEEKSRDIDGHQQQIDIVNYLIKNSKNETVGFVKYTEDMSTKKPFRTRYSIKQTDIYGDIILNKNWEE